MRTVKLGLFVGYCALIALLSLMAKPPGVDLGFGWQDKLKHASAYALLTLLGGWALAGRRRMTRRSLGWAALIAVVMGGMVEILQGTLTPYRAAEWGDMAANLAGALLAWGAARCWLSRQSPDSDTPRPPPEPGAAPRGGC